MGESERSLGDALLLQPSSQHGRWWGWPLVLLGVTLVGVLAAACVTWDRTAFMARCLHNGNAWQGCSCTYGALPDLPGNYRKLARTWAHGNSTDYTIAVMTLAVLETARAARQRIRAMAPTNGKHRTIRAWIADATEKLLGWKAVAAIVSGVSPKAVVVVSGLVAGDVGWTFAKARAAMGRHCGGSADTFMLRVVEAREALETAAASMTQTSIEQTLQALSAMGGAVTATGSWDGSTLKRGSAVGCLATIRSDASTVHDKVDCAESGHRQVEL